MTGRSCGGWGLLKYVGTSAVPSQYDIDQSPALHIVCCNDSRTVEYMCLPVVAFNSGMTSASKRLTYRNSRHLRSI